MVAVTFRLEPCPHCGSEAEVREHPVYRYQCKACGAPRIPTDRRWVSTPASVTRNLKQVRGHHIQRGLWLAASWASWIAALLCGLFGAGTAWSLDFGVPGWTFVSVITSLPLVLAVTSRWLAARQKQSAVSRLEDAWREIAEHFFASASTRVGNAPTLDDVKAAFRVDNDEALRLFAEGEVAAFLDREASSAIAGSGSTAHSRVRVAEPLPSSVSTTDEDEATDADVPSRQTRRD